MTVIPDVSIAEPRTLDQPPPPSPPMGVPTLKWYVNMYVRDVFARMKANVTSGERIILKINYTNKRTDSHITLLSRQLATQSFYCTTSLLLQCYFNVNLFVGTEEASTAQWATAVGNEKEGNPAVRAHNQQRPRTE